MGEAVRLSEHEVAIFRLGSRAQIDEIVSAHKALAWDQGAESGRVDEASGGWKPPTNPYRTECQYCQVPMGLRGVCVPCGTLSEDRP